MSKRKLQYTGTAHHWLSVIFTTAAVLLLSQGASHLTTLLLAAILGFYVIWNVWHHHSSNRLRAQTVIEYALVAALVWLVVSSVWN
jgi:uncharacterized membrane protein SpoIIM required for sporulation